MFVLQKPKGKILKRYIYLCFTLLIFNIFKFKFIGTCYESVLTIIVTDIVTVNFTNFTYNSLMFIYFGDSCNCYNYFEYLYNQCTLRTCPCFIWLYRLLELHFHGGLLSQLLWQIYIKWCYIWFNDRSMLLQIVLLCIKVWHSY